MISRGRFIWYELMTTDVEAAKAFYTKVVGWGARDASTPGLGYTLFTMGTASVGGLLELPEEGRKRGATPRWMGYVGVDDLNDTAERIKRLGGTVYLPPTSTNIGRVSVVADPQSANFGLVKGLKSGELKPAEPGGAPGRVGWHELFAVDSAKAFAFYRELFGWQKADSEIPPTDVYQGFSTGGQTMGGMFTKPLSEPIPYWVFYFNIGDIDEAVQRVETAGGRIFAAPLELPSGGWIVRCKDPQGAAFAIQGNRKEEGVAWSATWDGFSSKGKMVSKPRS
jgi:hypothetical protein